MSMNGEITAREELARDLRVRRQNIEAGMKTLAIQQDQLARQMDELSTVIRAIDSALEHLDREQVYGSTAYDLLGRTR